MAISGALTKQQIWSRILRIGLWCFGGGAAADAMGLYVLLSRAADSPAHPLIQDKLTLLTVFGFFPAVGALAFCLKLWIDSWMVVQFTCDDSSLRYKTQWSSYEEVRDLSEVAGLEPWGRRSDKSCVLRFRDGKEVLLSPRVPNAEHLIDWLVSHPKSLPSIPTENPPAPMQLMGKPSKATWLVLTVNLAAMAGSFLLLSYGASFQRPSVWVMAVQAGLPWMALALVAACPDRFSFSGIGRKGRCVPLFGVIFLSAFMSLSPYIYTSLVQKGPAALYGFGVGAIWFGLATEAEIRAKGRAAVMFIHLPLALMYGYAGAIQVNCVMDRSPAAVFQSVGHKVSYRGSHYLHIDPWGPAPAAKGLFNQYRVAVPLRVFNTLEDGGPVCVVQRQGALKMPWYTAQACPWNGAPVVLGLAGSLENDRGGTLSPVAPHSLTLVAPI